MRTHYCPVGPDAPRRRYGAARASTRVARRAAAPGATARYGPRLRMERDVAPAAHQQ